MHGTTLSPVVSVPLKLVALIFKKLPAAFDLRIYLKSDLDWPLCHCAMPLMNTGAPFEQNENKNFCKHRQK